jgi:uncharacterized protein YndB with AHSA1/START domain
MVSNNLVAKAEVLINASIEKVWDAFVNPEVIKKYMFGTQVNSEWKEGSEISWKGEWKGKSYEDKGRILKITPPEQLQYSHFSPLTGLEDKPENYHTVSIYLTKNATKTHVLLSQDNNANEEAKKHSETNWQMMLTSLKDLLEKGMDKSPT